jgi:hypothetical protein
LRLPQQQPDRTRDISVLFFTVSTESDNDNNNSTMASEQLEAAYAKYRYEALFGVWLVVTGATFLRIKRQPYSTRLKVEQYESIFKGTSLGAVLLGIGMTPGRTVKRVSGA